MKYLFKKIDLYNIDSAQLNREKIINQKVNDYIASLEIKDDDIINTEMSVHRNGDKLFLELHIFYRG